MCHFFAFRQIATNFTKKRRDEGFFQDESKQVDFK